MVSLSSCFFLFVFIESFKNRYNMFVVYLVCKGIIIMYVVNVNNEYFFYDMYCMYVFVYKVLRKINYILLDLRYELKI